jgi:hypothetical protein
MGELESHRFRQACAIELGEGILSFGKLAWRQRRGLDVRLLTRLTANPYTGIREGVETLSDYSAACRSFGYRDRLA